MLKIIVPSFLLMLCFAQTSLSAGVLDVKVHLSNRRDLVVTVSNMSKIPSTVDTATADMATGCRYEAAVGAVPPGSARTVTLATRRQLFACKAGTLKAFKQGKKVRLVSLGVEAPVVASGVPALPSLGPIHPSLPVKAQVPRESLSVEPSNSHVFKITVLGSTAEEQFLKVETWSLRVVR